MKKSISISLVLISFAFVRCQNTNTSNNTGSTDSTALEDSTAIHDEHTSQNSLDWAGTYQDTIPCADCPGIFTTIKLYEDGTYAYRAEYLERQSTVQDTGKFMWHNNGSVVHLKGKNIDTKYKVGENVLLQTDEKGNIIEGEMADLYTIKKVF